jgi:hypothetical protein
MKKFTLNLKKCFCILFCAALCVFYGFVLPEEPLVCIQNSLQQHYDLDAAGKEIKRFELNVTNTGICRYRKIYTNGKEEYFAFNLNKFKNMDFYGTTAKGNLYLRTKNDDVIVQTRNDKKGDVDSMATCLIIPLRNIEADQLNSLAAQFKKHNETSLVINQ